MATYETSHFRTPLLEPRPGTWNRSLYKPCERLRESLHSLICSVLSNVKSIWATANSDPSKVINSLKLGFALLLGFLLVFLDLPSEQLSEHAVWAVMTIIVVFEHSIGASLSKGCNRGGGTLVAGLLAVGIGQIASLSGGVGHPILISMSAFILGGVVTFARLRASLKPYDMGCRTFLLTYSLIIVAEYRAGDPLSTAINRFLIIMLGAIIGIAVNIAVFPRWAGDDLHRSIAKNFENVADSLEVCVDGYLRGVLLERIPSKILMGLSAEDPVYKGYRSALYSASKEESLAGFASWEPPHGKFRMFKYPWHAYVKIGAVLRYCAYSVVALHACLRSSIQAPMAVRAIFERELREVSSEVAEALRKLSKQVEKMQKADCTEILKSVLQAVERLQMSLSLHSYLLVQEETGIFEDHVQNLCVNIIPDSLENCNCANALPSWTGDEPKMAPPQDESNSGCARLLQKLHSWPSGSLDDMDFSKDSVFPHRVRVLETASALSLGTFATLLMEVALRLEYVVDAVEELSCLAKFKEAREISDTTVSRSSTKAAEML